METWEADVSELVGCTALSWRTPEGRRVLDDVCLSVQAGDRVAVAGPSGTGKSTLLRCLVALEAPHAGEVRWRGEVVGPHNVLAARRDVRWLPQRPVAIAASLAEELAMLDAGLDDVAHVLDALELAVDPGQGMATMSGGEQQRWAVARALLGFPSVLLLDEPTAALDADNVALLEGFLLSWADGEGRALVWVSHDAAGRARMCTRTLRLGA